jgi:hypothetical protein
MSRALAISLCAGIAPAALAQTFTPLALAPAPYNGPTQVTNISGDGSRIAGNTETPTSTFTRAGAWNADGTFAASVPFSIPGEISTAAAMSNDGTQLFGTRSLPFGPTLIARPFRYNIATGVTTVFGTTLGTNATDIDLNDVDATGTFALVTRIDPTLSVHDVLRVEVATNAATPFGGARNGFAMSANATTAVGDFIDSNARGWRTVLGNPGLDQNTCEFSNDALCQTQFGPTLPRSADAQAISPEGNWIGGGALVGDGYGGGTDVPYATNGTDLFVATLDGCGYGGGATLDISAETIPGGPVVVGRFGCNNQPQAFFWTASEGLVYVQDYLSNAGIDMSSWFLTETTAVSDDGLTLAGNGFFLGTFRSWVATRVPGGGPVCDDIDFNNNGVFPEDQDVVDFFDVLAGGSPSTCDPVEGCNDIDFNNNDVFPEDQDVVDFFNVLAGGDCP